MTVIGLVVAIDLGIGFAYAGAIGDWIRTRHHQHAGRGRTGR